MSEAQVIDSDAVEETVEPAESTAAMVPTGGATLAVTPQVQAADLVTRLDVIKEASEKAMKDGVDFGTVGGTNKPTLLKPGAEKLSVLFQLDVQIENEKHFEGDGHLTVVSKATVYHAPTGSRLGFGEGLCTTREKKYAKRKVDRQCPACGEEAIKKSKYPPRSNPDAAPGWYCYSKLGGCGKEFEADDATITDQEAGEKENPDLPDTWNTVVKMAEKRARVDAVLAVTGASALFTQDLDERVEQTAGVDLPPASADDKTSLAVALQYLLPEQEAKVVWGQVKQAFGGELYAPAAQAIVAVISAKKALDE